MDRKEWEAKVRSMYIKPRLFSPARIIENKSGECYNLTNNKVEFQKKGLTYRLENWVETKLTVIWSDGTESLEFKSTWLPDFLKWVCIKYIINFHPNNRN